MVHDVTKLRHHYVTSSAFKLDVISLLPTDLVFFVSYEYYVVIARLNRVLRIVRLWELFERTESSTSSPNSFRIGVLVFYLLTAIHWNTWSSNCQQSFTGTPGHSLEHLIFYLLTAIHWNTWYFTC